MFWWILVTLLAFFVKGLCGFANTLVFTSILSFGNSNINISPVDFMLTYPPNLIMAWKERRNIQWSMFVPLSAMIVIGSVPGILFLKNADVSLLKILFGTLVIFFGVEMLIRELQKKKIKQSKQALILEPFMLIGLILGMKSSSVLDEKIVKKAVIVMLIISGIALIITSL